jgi:Thiopurine S-methyltransferase (TPMT)
MNSPASPIHSSHGAHAPEGTSPLTPISASSRFDSSTAWLDPPPVIEELKPTSGPWVRSYDELYSLAYGDPVRLPWHRAGPSRVMVEWLNAEAPQIVRPGACAVVVGCGLGDDVSELAGRGYEAWGFAWAHARHPAHVERLMHADLFELPTKLIRKADFVVDIDTLSALPPVLWPRVMASLASLARPKGAMLLIERAASSTTSAKVTGRSPPFAIHADDLRALAESIGWSACKPIEEVACDCLGAAGDARELCAVLRRG